MKIYYTAIVLLLVLALFQMGCAMEKEISNARLIEHYSARILMHSDNVLYGINDRKIYMTSLDYREEPSANQEKDIDSFEWDRVPALVVLNYMGCYVSQVRPIQCAIVDRDKQRLFLGCDSGGIKIWNTSTDKIEETDEFSDSFYDDIVDFSQGRNGNLCSASAYGSIKIWDVRAEKCRRHLVPNSSYDVSFTKLLADDDMLYAAGYVLPKVYWQKKENLLITFDARAHRPHCATNIYNGCVTHLARSKKDTEFYAASEDGTVALWDKRNMMYMVSSLKSNGRVESVVENKEGTRLVTCGNTGVELWDITQDKPLLEKTLVDEPVMCMDLKENNLFISTRNGIKFLNIKEQDLVDSEK